MAKDQIQWYICKGDPLPDAAPVWGTHERTFRTSPGTIIHNLVACDLDVPPTRLTQAVYPVSMINADLSSISLDKFEKKSRFMRKTYYRARYAHMHMCNKIEKPC